ncbi:MAG: glycosyltransferase family 4 protein [Chloroflexi bacterium]|nr:glycosyltransferase family 4 protein [Chloroflexota bacterium]
MNNTRPLPLLYLHPSNELYGSDRSLIRLTTGLDPNTYVAHVILPDDLNYQGLLSQSLEQCGIQFSMQRLGVLRRQYFTPWGMALTFVQILQAGWQLARYCRQNQIALIHSNSTAVLAGAIAAKLARVPHIWHVREIITHPRWFNKFVSWCLAWGADQIIAVSQSTLENLTQVWPSLAKKTIVLHNGLDPTPFLANHTAARASIRQQWEVPTSGLVIGCIGRISAWKGQFFLLEATVPILKQYPHCHLVFVGGPVPGQEWRIDDLHRFIGTHNLQNQVHIESFQSDVAPLLAAFDIFVSPSTLPDPFPGVVVEAMFAAKPIIATNHGGPVEQLAHGRAGLLVDPNSPLALTQALQSLIVDNHLRHKLGQSSFDYAMSQFTVDQHVTNMSQIYQTILAK